MALAACALGCSPMPEEAHYIRLTVDTDLSSPQELDAFSIRVERSGETIFEQNYDDASFRYGNGRKEVPLPLCFDCLDKECPSGDTCRRGACVDDGIEPQSDDDTVDTLAACGPR